MKKNILISAALMFLGLTASAQTSITFDSDDYKSISVYDQWEESPFRTGKLKGNAAVADNPDMNVDETLGVAPNSTNKVLALQRSRFASNAYGVRIDLKEPIRVKKQFQYIHVMTYLKDKPEASRMMVIGLGKRVEESWNWQTGEEEQFWAITTTDVKPKEGWQDIVVKFKGFSYSKEENENSGIDIYSLVIVPDVRSPHSDESDWVAYFDEIVIDEISEKRFSTDKYALTYGEDATVTRNDRHLNGVALAAGGKNFSSEAVRGIAYTNNTLKSVFSATAGMQVQPSFNYTGSWMSGYVYVDWGNDGLFKATLNDNGIPAADSDLVSYNAFQINGTWYKSDGTVTANGNTIGSGVPQFTVPEKTLPGFYRMRYKVDWNSIDPAGDITIIDNGGGYVDVMLDVHGDEVSVSASQLNGDIVLASDNSPLQNYITAYGQPLTVKVIPEKGFVQYGFTLKYGYNVNATEQFDDNGNPNWIQVNVPVNDIAADGTYTIPAEYIRGGYVSIAGDMQQVRQYTVEVVGGNGNGGIVYSGAEYKNGATVDATQYLSVNEITAIALEGYISDVTIDKENCIIKVEYTKIEDYREVTTLSELKNDMAYHIKAKSGEGYWAWNTTITDTYISLRGVTNTSYNNAPSNASVADIYKETIDPFDNTVVWQILLEDGKYYLYQPAKQEYVTRSGRDYIFTSEKKALDVIRDNGDGTFAIHAGGDYSDNSTFFACIVTNENTTAVRNWTWSDHGSILQFIENPNVKVEVDTSVDEITIVEDNANYGIYNLQGQKLESLPSSGIVIVNGKKVLVK